VRKVALAVLVVALSALPATASVLDFNDLATTQVFAGAYAPVHWDTVPTSYDGYIWTNWEVIEGQDFDVGYETSIFTGPFPENALYNGGDGFATTTISSSNPFDLLSGTFSSWPNIGGAAAGSITVTGYNGSNVVGSTVVSLTTGFTPTTLNLDNVTSVTFTAPAEGQYWLTNGLDLTSSPEPSSIWLFVLAFPLMAVAKLRFRQR